MLVHVEFGKAIRSDIFFFFVSFCFLCMKSLQGYYIWNKKCRPGKPITVASTCEKSPSCRSKFRRQEHDAVNEHTRSECVPEY